MATGHEEEFRRLFETEARTRLDQLAEQALELEARGDDAELVNAMYRNAHTVKGGAGVVGLPEVVEVTHDLEQVLDDLRAGRRAPSRVVADALLGAVDALGELIRRAIDGEATGEAAARARAALAGAEAGPAPPALPAAREPAEPPAEPAMGRRRDDARDAIPVPVARLDALVRLVGESAAAQLRVGRLLAERLGAEPVALDEYRDLARILDQLHAQAMRARMVSVGAVAGALRRTVRDIGAQSGKEVRWELAGEDTELDRHVLERLREPLVALVRNAIDHGIEFPVERRAAGKDPVGRVLVHAMQVGSEVIVTVSDDGCGIDPARVAAAAGGGPMSRREALDAIFRPGVSTADRVTGVSGRGVGLDEVRTAVEDVRGTLAVHSVPGEGTEFRIAVPITLAILRCLLVCVGGERYAVPMPACVALLGPDAADGLAADGRPAVWVGDEAVGLSDLAALLGTGDVPAAGPIVVLSTSGGRHAFRVDELAGQRDVVIKDIGRALPRIEVLAGASIEPDGRVLPVLDASGLIAAAGSAAPAPPASHRAALPPSAEAPRKPPTVLVVDDALTIRELQRSILQRAGYHVLVAASGAEALERLASEQVDLVLTDVEMPGMDGLELTRRIRSSSAAANVPVIVLTSRGRDEDRQRGLEAGADAYVVKSAFDEHTLLTGVARLLGDGS